MSWRVFGIRSAMTIPGWSRRSRRRLRSGEASFGVCRMPARASRPLRSVSTPSTWPWASARSSASGQACT
eukprot:685058-Alexandrium_andersonii.AAC.1